MMNPHLILFGPNRTSKSDAAMRIHVGPVLQAGSILLAWMISGGGPASGQNQVRLDLVDADTREPIPARIEFTPNSKKPKTDRRISLSGETWLAEGTLSFQPQPGDYEFLVQRGPEFNSVRGGFTAQRGSRDTVLIEVPRSIDMHAEGWYSGDLSSDLEPSLLKRWQAADAIDMVVHAAPPSAANGLTATDGPKAPEKPATSTLRRIEPSDAPKWDGPNEVGYRWLNSSIEYRLPTLGLAIHRLPPSQDPSDTPTRFEDSNTSRDVDDPYDVLESIEMDPDAFAEITNLLAGDLPILLAHPKVRCARVLHVANRPGQDVPLELDRNAKAPLFATWTADLGKIRWTVPVLAPFPDRDRIRFRGPRGAGQLSEAIYWMALNSGLRLPPTAASGFQAGKTHLGYNRVYAYCDSEPTPDAWWHAILQGESFVTNGPLLRVKINEVPPGTVQGSYRGEPIPLGIDISLSVRDPVDYLDVIFNGETIYNAKLEDHYRRGEFPPLEIQTTGWLVVRVVTAHEEGYRVASTAPFYFDFGEGNRTDRKAVEFFLEWLNRTTVHPTAVTARSRARERAIERAKQFWEQRLAESK